MEDSKADRIYNDIFGDSDDDLEEDHAAGHEDNTNIQPVLSSPSSLKRYGVDLKGFELWNQICTWIRVNGFTSMYLRNLKKMKCFIAWRT